LLAGAIICIALYWPHTPAPPRRATVPKTAAQKDTEKTWDYGEKKKTSGLMTVRGTYWCGRSFDDAGMIGVAVSRGDTAALAGLIARGNAFQVEGGTRVISGGEVEMGISLVHVESGFQAGQKCYIATNALR
jgi:hypothetical protein